MEEQKSHGAARFLLLYLRLFVLPLPGKNESVNKHLADLFNDHKRMDSMYVRLYKNECVDIHISIYMDVKYIYIYMCVCVPQPLTL